MINTITTILCYIVISPALVQKNSGKNTSCVIFSYPKLLSITVLMKINTELCCKRYDSLTKKTQNYRYQNYCLDDNIQIYSYGLLCEHGLSLRTVKQFRNNKQHVVLGQKRNCQRVAESGL